ncbi:MAG: hypothetical protein AB7V32_08635, partial [Candidatus Berkiella sp.]
HDIVTKNQLTAIMITHHLADALEYGNRLILMHQGSIVLDLNAKQKKSLTIPKLLRYFHEGIMPSAMTKTKEVC